MFTLKVGFSSPLISEFDQPQRSTIPSLKTARFSLAERICWHSYDAGEERITISGQAIPQVFFVCLVCLMSLSRFAFKLLYCFVFLVSSHLISSPLSPRLK